jgi:hypothetical protein
MKSSTRRHRARQMTVLVTGSPGHLGEGIVRTLRAAGNPVLALDAKASAFTDRVGSILDRAFVRECLSDVSAVIHAATLHKPHLATHSFQDFVDANVTGTRILLEEVIAAHSPRRPIRLADGRPARIGKSGRLNLRPDVQIADVRRAAGLLNAKSPERVGRPRPFLSTLPSLRLRRRSLPRGNGHNWDRGGTHSWNAHAR